MHKLKQNAIRNLPEFSSIKVRARMEVPTSWLTFVRMALFSEMRVHEHNRFFPDHILV